MTLLGISRVNAHNISPPVSNKYKFCWCQPERGVDCPIAFPVDPPLTIWALFTVPVIVLFPRLYLSTHGLKLDCLSKLGVKIKIKVAQFVSTHQDYHHPNFSVSYKINLHNVIKGGINDTINDIYHWWYRFRIRLVFIYRRSKKTVVLYCIVSMIVSMIPSMISLIHYYFSFNPDFSISVFHVSAIVRTWAHSIRLTRVTSNTSPIRKIMYLSYKCFIESGKSILYLNVSLSLFRIRKKIRAIQKRCR